MIWNETLLGVQPGKSARKVAVSAAKTRLSKDALIDPRGE